MAHCTCGEIFPEPPPPLAASPVHWGMVMPLCGAAALGASRLHPSVAFCGGAGFWLWRDHLIDTLLLTASSYEKAASVRRGVARLASVQVFYIPIMTTPEICVRKWVA